MTQANSAALPLPQIYYPGGGIPTDQAGQWGWLSEYADSHSICLDQYGIPRGVPGRTAFEGVTASNGICRLRPGVALQRLWMTLDGISCVSPAPSDMTHIAPIRYFP